MFTLEISSSQNECAYYCVWSKVNSILLIPFVEQFINEAKIVYANGKYPLKPFKAFILNVSLKFTKNVVSNQIKRCDGVFSIVVCTVWGREQRNAYWILFGVFCLFEKKAKFFFRCITIWRWIDTTTNRNTNSNGNTSMSLHICTDNLRCMEKIQTTNTDSR